MTYLNRSDFLLNYWVNIKYRDGIIMRFPGISEYKTGFFFAKEDQRDNQRSNETEFGW
jgi:hypothetical protein